MDKKGAEAIHYVIALIIGIIVVFVVINIFTYHAKKASKGLSEIGEEAKINVTKCASLVFGRFCHSSPCPEGSVVFPGKFSDCKSGEVCCERT
ncbi:hypothetical protein DRJ22_04710 [Candidatus Woesearchaeota archaeon]|nr:MAG: hypothetical protein DRJ22_04710 [Candidatus Woesearchaeota archaeon]